MGISTSPRKIRLLASTESTSFFSLDSTGAARVSGRFTFTPCWMRGAVTMKMISRTSITSTMGVTLISLIVVRPGAPLPPDMAMTRCSAPLLEEVPLDDVQEVRREIGHLGVEHLDPADERIVRHHRRDGGEEASGGGHQGVPDRRRHGGEGRVALLGDLVEGGEDAHHRPEEAHEGSSGSHRAQEAHPRLQLGDLRGAGPVQGPLHVLDPPQPLAHRVLSPLLALGELGELLVPGDEDPGDGGAGEVPGRLVDGVEAGTFPEGVEEGDRLVAGPVELDGLDPDQGPGHHRDRDQEGEDRQLHRRGLPDDGEVVDRRQGDGELGHRGCPSTATRGVRLPSTLEPARNVPLVRGLLLGVNTSARVTVHRAIAAARWSSRGPPTCAFLDSPFPSLPSVSLPAIQTGADRSPSPGGSTGPAAATPGWSRSGSPSPGRASTPTPSTAPAGWRASATSSTATTRWWSRPSTPSPARRCGAGLARQPSAAATPR